MTDLEFCSIVLSLFSMNSFCDAACSSRSCSSTASRASLQGEFMASCSKRCSCSVAAGGSREWCSERRELMSGGARRLVQTVHDSSFSPEVSARVGLRLLITIGAELGRWRSGVWCASLPASETAVPERRVSMRAFLFVCGYENSGG